MPLAVALAACGPNQPERSDPVAAPKVTDIDAGMPADATAPVVEAKGPSLPAQRPGRDVYGDPLPELAWARLGTRRLRHAGVVRAVTYSPDGTLLATAGDDGVIRLWSAKTYELVRELARHRGPVRCLTFSPKGFMLVSGGADGHAIIWKVRTGAVIRNQGGHDKPVVNVGFSGDGSRLMSASADRVRVVETRTGKLLGQYRPRAGRSYSFALFRSGRYVVSARDAWMPGGKLDIWKVGTKRAYSTSGPKAWPRAVAVSRAGWKYAQLVRLQHPRDPEVVRGYKVFVRAAGNNAVRRILTRRHRRGDPDLLVFSPDGNLLVVARSGHLDVWDARSGHRRRTIAVPFISATSVAVAPDGKSLAVASRRHHTVLIYDLATGKPSPLPQGNPGPVVALDATSAGARVVVAHGAVESAAEWQVGPVKRLGVFASPVIAVRRGARDVVYAGGGRLVITAHDNCLMQVWQRDTQQLLERIGCRPKGAQPALRHGRGRSVLVDGTTYVFHNRRGVDRATAVDPAVAQRAKVAAVVKDAGTITAHAYSSDGKLLAVGRDDGSIGLWRAAVGERVATVRGHSGAVLSLQFSHDSKLLFSGGADTTVLVWDAVAAFK